MDPNYISHALRQQDPSMSKDLADRVAANLADEPVGSDAWKSYPGVLEKATKIANAKPLSSTTPTPTKAAAPAYTGPNPLTPSPEDLKRRSIHADYWNSEAGKARAAELEQQKQRYAAVKANPNSASPADLQWARAVDDRYKRLTTPVSAPPAATPTAPQAFINSRYPTETTVPVVPRSNTGQPGYAGGGTAVIPRAPATDVRAQQEWAASHVRPGTGAHTAQGGTALIIPTPAQQPPTQSHPALPAAQELMTNYNMDPATAAQLALALYGEGQ